jgi:hypothetical protein
MLYVLACLVVWVLLSFPLGIFIGMVIHVGSVSEPEDE